MDTTLIGFFRLTAAVALACTAIATAAGGQESTSTPDGWSENVVIFTPERVEALQAGSYDPLRTLGLVSVDWTPSKDDVQTLERSLPAYLRTFTSENIRDIADRFSTYKREYFGYLARGERRILLYAFCGEGLDLMWRETVPEIFDGGNCVLRVRYNADQRRFEWLEINGSA